MVIKWDVTIPPLTGEKIRRGYVYLPESYDREPEKRYPVLYMFDGHNVFFDEDATFGKSWGMKDYLDRNSHDLIIVGIECNNEGWRRLNEYSPVDFSYEEIGSIKGEGQVYMDWLVGTLKPYIDATYRTLPDREHTAIGGSSMGGLMALYAAVHHNRWFSKAACISSAIGFCMRPLMADMRASSIDPDTRIYLSWGTKEAWGLKNTDREDRSSKTYDWNKRVADYAAGCGAAVKMRCQVGGGHCEADWERLVPEFMHFLWME